jgi:hypothetical protein
MELTIFLLVLVYFLPTIMAWRRYHKNLMPIMAVNIVLGWTFVFWFVAFVWSLTSNVKNEV